MATKITWENKEGIQNDESIPRKNKVMDDDMNEIKQAVNNNADELNEAQENINNLQDGQGTANADITNLKGRVTTLETDNTQNKSDINTLKSDNETNKSNIQQLQNKQQETETNVGTLQGKVNTLETDNTQNKENIENLQEDNVQNKADISTLKLDNESNKTNISTLQENVSNLDTNKVDKVEGKGLSSNDFTNEYKQKLDNLENYNDTEIKEEIESLKSDNTTNKSNIENLQENDATQNELISKLKSALINVETEEAKSLHVEDASTVPAQLSVTGNQEQETSVQGKNYFTGNKINSGTILGITYSFDNSILKANGTSTVSGSIVLDADTGVKLPAGTYTYTVKKVAGDYTRQNGQDFALYLKNDSDWITGDYATSGITGSNLQNNSGIYSRQITITEETEIYFRFFVSSANIVFNNLELEIQIESGSEYTEFEQFVPNMPSPNYPSEVICLGSNKNLLHMQEKSYTQLGVNVTQKESCLKLDGTTNGAQNILSGGYVDIGNFKKGKYSFKAHISGSFERQGKNDFAFYIRKKDDTSKIYGSIGGATIENSRNSFTFELTEDTDLVIQIWANASGIIFNNFEMKLKVEEGDNATSYSPYRTR